MRYFIKILIIVLALIASISLVSGQDEFVVFRGGISAGLAASQISGDQLSGFNKAGIFAGGFINFRFTQRSAFQMEMNYIQKGSRRNPYYKLNLQYIEIPLLYKWLFTKWLHFEIGPTFGVCMKTSDVEKSYGGIIPNRSSFKWYELGVLAGVYFNLTENWQINFRGENSVLPVRPHSGGGVYRLNRGQYNSVLVLDLRYQF